MNNENKFLKGLKWFFNSFIWLFVLFLVVDVVTKLIVAHNMEVGDNIVLIPGFLKITYTLNPAAAFGLGSDNPTVNRIVYMIIASLGVIFIVFYFVKKYNSLTRYVKACLMLILTGAVGNLIDRSFYKFSDFCVVDWINFFDNEAWHWIFNIADSCVVVGVFMLVIYLIVDEVKEYKVKKAKEPVDNSKLLSKTEQEKQSNEQENIIDK